MENASQEQSERKEGPFTKEEVIEAFRDGDRMEGMRRFDEWLSRNQAETDSSSTSLPRLEIQVQTLEILGVFEDKDNVLFKCAETELAVHSDTTIGEGEQKSLLERIAHVQAAV